MKRYRDIDKEDYIIFDGRMCIVKRVMYFLYGKRLPKPWICSAIICNRYGEPTGKEVKPGTNWEFTVREQREELPMKQLVAKWENDNKLGFMRV